MPEPKWRVGRTLDRVDDEWECTMSRKLYVDGTYVGMVDTPELAAAIVTKMNERPSSGVACAHCLGARVVCFNQMKAVPCPYPGIEHRCANTGHHACPHCC